MKQNSFRLLKLINNLTDITKLDSSFFQLNLVNMNVVEVVENITMSVADYINTKDINLTFDTDTEEKILACDPNQIERIILNLLSNSVKFTDAGGNIWVTIKDKDDFVAISVKDDGIGIPKDKINTIFDRYSVVDKSYVRNHQGSGIGLSLVKSLVEKHNGKIFVQSKVNKGTEFTIELPSVLTKDKSNHHDKNMSGQTPVERISIEFPDIYSID